MDATLPVPRFHAVRLEDGWAVIDRDHGSPVRVGIEFQTGLSEQAAWAVASRLNRPEAG